jgi:hypothetical protein
MLGSWALLQTPEHAFGLAYAETAGDEARVAIKMERVLERCIVIDVCVDADGVGRNHGKDLVLYATPDNRALMMITRVSRRIEEVMYLLLLRE